MGKYQGKHYKQNKHKKNKVKLRLIKTIIFVIILPILTIIISYLSYKAQVTANKNAILTEKPSINLAIDYFDEQFEYIDKITFDTNDTSLVKAEINVEPFLDIIFYSPNKKCLIREILPIYDLEKIDSHFMPYSLNLLNTNYGRLAEFSLNKNSYSIIDNFNNLCNNQRYTSSYDRILPEIFGEYILTAISLEMYIIVDYYDKFENQYKDIYLCTTGHRCFTGNVVNSVLESKTSVNEEVLHYNIEHTVIYVKLESYMKDFTFSPNLEKVQESDIIFEELDNFFSDLVHKNGMTNYIVNMNEQLEKLIGAAYTKKQLVFILTLDEPYWQTLE